MTVPLQFYFCFQIFPIFVAEEKYFRGKTTIILTNFKPTYLFFFKGLPETQFLLGLIYNYKNNKLEWMSV